MTEVTQKTPAEKKEQAKANRIAGMARARAARKAKLEIKEVESLPETGIGEIAIKVKPSDDGDIKFFSEKDLRIDGKGNITGRNCDYPQWYFPKIINDMKEEIRQSQFAIDSGKYPQGRITEAKDKLSSLKKNLSKLEETQPDFTKYKDTLYKVSQDLGSKIAEKMSTRSQQQKGLADAHRDVQIESTPSIDISDSPQIRRMADVNGVRVTNGKITGGDATRMWQWSRKAIGEDGNSEWLRRD